MFLLLGGFLFTCHLESRRLSNFLLSLPFAFFFILFLNQEWGVTRPEALALSTGLSPLYEVGISPFYVLGCWRSELKNGQFPPPNRADIRLEASQVPIKNLILSRTQNSPSHWRHLHRAHRRSTCSLTSDILYEFWWTEIKKYQKQTQKLQK